MILKTLLTKTCIILAGISIIRNHLTELLRCLSGISTLVADCGCSPWRHFKQSVYLFFFFPLYSPCKHDHQKTALSMIYICVFAQFHLLLSSMYIFFNKSQRANDLYRPCSRSLSYFLFLTLSNNQVCFGQLCYFRDPYRLKSYNHSARYTGIFCNNTAQESQQRVLLTPHLTECSYPHLSSHLAVARGSQLIFAYSSHD